MQKDRNENYKKEKQYIIYVLENHQFAEIEMCERVLFLSINSITIPTQHFIRWKREAKNIHKNPIIFVVCLFPSHKNRLNDFYSVYIIDQSVSGCLSRTEKKTQPKLTINLLKIVQVQQYNRFRKVSIFSSFLFLMFCVAFSVVSHLLLIFISYFFLQYFGSAWNQRNITYNRCISTIFVHFHLFDFEIRFFYSLCVNFFLFSSSYFLSSFVVHISLQLLMFMSTIARSIHTLVAFKWNAM